jgi:hypothetical protein
MALLSKETVTKIRTEDKERKAQFGTGDKRPHITAGEHILYISKPYLKTSKGGDAMLILELSENEGTQPLKENFMLAGKGADYGLSRIVTFLANAFGFEIPECENEEALLKQIMPFQGKPFKAAVRVKEQLWANQNKLSVIKKPELWYESSINDTSFSVKTDKLVVPLTAPDKQSYLDYLAAEKITSATEAAKGSNDLPF